MKVAIYTRVSTEQQELKQQIEACKMFANFKRLKINQADIYSDIGSGKDFFNRPNFTRLLSALREKKYQALIVFRLDRLGRNVREALNLFEELEKQGITLYSVHEQLDTTTAIGRAIRTVILVLAQLEREMISEATKQRLMALKESGIKLGRPPTHLTAEQLNEYITFTKQGGSYKQLEAKTGIPSTVLWRALSKARAQVLDKF